MKRDDLLDLIPAYALGALDADERAAVEALLATDGEAQAVLAAHQELANSLVLFTPAREAPGHLAADLRQRVAAKRVGIAESRSRSVRRVIALAAALALIFGGVLGWALTRDDRLPGEQLFTEIAAGPDKLQIELTAGEDQNASGVLVASADGMQAVVQVWQLPGVAADQRFQLWLVDDDGARSAGLFSAQAADGPTYVVLPLDRPIHSYNVVGVSIEPHDGSPLGDQPTGPNVFRVLLQT